MYKPLSQDELDQSAIGPKFDNVKFEDLLRDGALAQRVRTLNPARYRDLRQDYLWRTGAEPRPANAFD
jgi:hypothetical protein